LKPDVCRRVVGRLPSPHIQSGLQKPILGSTARDGATIQLRLPRIETRRGKDHGGLSCEIVRTNARIRFSRLARST
jgi:hypothetical protein